jgi:hypothetical protein
MIISINSQSCGRVMVIRLDTDYGELIVIPLKRGGAEKGVVWLKGMEAVGFCGPCVCLGIFLL